MRPLLLLAPLALLTVTACGTGDDDGSSGTAPTTSDTAPTTSGSATTPPPTTLRPAPVTDMPVEVGSTPAGGSASGPSGTADEQTAIDDLAERLDVDASAVTVVSTDEVTWRDGSMGCPEPGMNYLQSLVPGIRIVLEVDGARYEYHAGGARTIFFCADPQPPVDG